MSNKFGGEGFLDYLTAKPRVIKNLEIFANE